MNIRKQANAMDEMVTKGLIVDAVKTYFAENADSSDYGDVSTASKAQKVEKLDGFVGSIAKVNGITHHHTIADGNASASEFTFDFDMKDGGKIYWHEIIRRIWNDEGKVTNEEYFNAG